MFGSDIENLEGFDYGWCEFMDNLWCGLVMVS